MEIVPAFLVESEKEFETKLRQVENDTKLIQVDVLDGGLFPNTTWYDAHAIGALKTDVEIEAHLMIENPIPVVEAFQKNIPTFVRAIVHAEIKRPLGVVVGHIRDILGLKVGVAINPETPLEEIHSVLHQIDQLTIMGVHPGHSGQKFEGGYILEKIKQARAHCPELNIEIDGGVTLDLIPKLIAAGANRICAASLLFNNENPTNQLKMLNE